MRSRTAPMAGASGAQERRLAALLEAREGRAARQAALSACFGLPVLSLTLVSPGAEKSGPEFSALMDLAEAALDREFRGRGLRLLVRERAEGPAGPELLGAVSRLEVEEGRLPVPSAAVELGLEAKRAALALEEAEPWGRLLDADLLLDTGEGPEPIRRERLGHGPRPCLVCGQSALECITARRHDSAAAEARARELRSAALESNQVRTTRDGRPGACPGSVPGLRAGTA